MLLARVARLSQLTLPPGNQLEPLKGNREGQHSIRVNEQYRICFLWTDQGRTKEQARQSLSEAMELILEDRREDALRGVPDDVERETVTLE